MGDMADYYADLAMDYYADLAMDSQIDTEFRIKKINSLYKKGVLKWTTKNGEAILISKMTESHIKNTINYLIRERGDDNYVLAMIEILKTELKKRKKNNENTPS